MSISSSTHRGLSAAASAGRLWRLLTSEPSRGPRRPSWSKRLSDDVRFLSDDAREGRGPGTKGIDAAADFIAERFARSGLKTDLWNGGPFQKFKITIGEKLGTPNTLTFVGPPATEGAGPAPQSLG